MFSREGELIFVFLFSVVNMFFFFFSGGRVFLFFSVTMFFDHAMVFPFVGRTRSRSEYDTGSVDDGVYDTPLSRFSMLGISTVGIVSVPKRSAFEASRRELFEDASFGIGTLVVVERSSLEKRPRGV